jgi:hypothetical protein
MSNFNKVFFNRNPQWCPGKFVFNTEGEKTKKAAREAFLPYFMQGTDFWHVFCLCNILN